MAQAPKLIFSHFSICVSDRELSERFYTEALGFTLDYYVDVGPPFDVLTELPGIKSRVGFFKHGDVKIELLSYDHPTTIGSKERKPMHQVGLTHISFIVDDLKATVARIVEYGGQCLEHTFVKGAYGDMIFCTDPDGVRIEIWEKTA